METAEKKAGAQGANAKANGTVNKTGNRPNLTGKEAKQGENTNNAAPDQGAQTADNQNKAGQAGSSPAVGNQPSHAEKEQGNGEVKKEALGAGEQANEAKAGIKYVKPALNLEQTLKSVGDLHRLSLQRLALIARIKLLEDFEVKLTEEGDELSNNPYEGCRLIIKDDKGREFVTNTPNLIRMVSQFIFDACHNKLSEIEAHIVFPNA